MTYRPRHVKHQGESLVIHEGRHIKESPTTRSTLRRAVAGTAIVAAPFAMAAPAFAEQNGNLSDESSQVETSTQQLIDFADNQIDITEQADASQDTTEEVAGESSADSEDDEFNLGYVSLETQDVDSEDNDGAAEPENQDADSSQADETNQPNETEAEASDQTNDSETEVEVADDSQPDTESADSEAEDQLADQSVKSTKKPIQETDNQPEDSVDELGNETDDTAKSEPKESKKTKQANAEKEPSLEADDLSKDTEFDFGFVSLESDEEDQPVESNEVDNTTDEKSDDEATESDTQSGDGSIDLGFTSLPDGDQIAEVAEPSSEEDEQQDQDAEFDLGFTSLPESDTPSDEGNDETDSTESKAREEDDGDELDLGFTTYDSASVEQEPAPAKEDADASEQKPKPEEVVKKKSNSEIAQEVIDGKWGVNDERINRLEEAGYNPDSVQDEVNKLMDSNWRHTHELDGQVKSVVGYALDQGDKDYTYRLGAGTQNGPTGNQFDCSSFTSSAWKDGAGIDIGRSAQQQWNNGNNRGQVIAQGHSIKMSDLQPGDLIFEAWGRRGPVGNSNAVSHVTMYVGGGKTVEWSRSQNGYAYRDARVSGPQIVGAVRPAAPDGSNS